MIFTRQIVTVLFLLTIPGWSGGGGDPDGDASPVSDDSGADDDSETKSPQVTIEISSSGPIEPDISIFYICKLRTMKNEHQNMNLFAFHFDWFEYFSQKSFSMKSYEVLPAITNRSRYDNASILLTTSGEFNVSRNGSVIICSLEPNWMDSENISNSSTRFLKLDRRKTRLIASRDSQQQTFTIVSVVVVVLFVLSFMSTMTVALKAGTRSDHNANLEDIFQEDFNKIDFEEETEVERIIAAIPTENDLEAATTKSRDRSKKTVTFRKEEESQKADKVGSDNIEDLPVRRATAAADADSLATAAADANLIDKDDGEDDDEDDDDDLDFDIDVNNVDKFMLIQANQRITLIACDRRRSPCIQIQSLRQQFQAPLPFTL
ncbi:hypothetical protein HELRODRAFT_174114 [Helobdella robusta]|uniref:Uncharacterized protein n=1 Tax=Helobdella robusta TaxID=6412 RepID=T1F7M7_HELRO|nr:hypothetical protein HELRODRAFT_174114 [Helobdella robusta]ESO03215.1 hypothetical protein HELRODRAFT_174114 [Helobdella robusta]